MPTVHLISGLPCSGKTTYARDFRSASDAVVFSLDRWLITAFDKYSIASVGHEEHTKRVLACRELIWETAVEFVRRSVDVILDDGFFLRENRMRYAALAHAAGAQTTIHFLNTPLATIQTRLDERNANLPRFNFSIDRETLLVFSELFEIPSGDEASEVVVVRSPIVRSPRNTSP